MEIQSSFPPKMISNVNENLVRNGLLIILTSCVEKCDFRINIYKHIYAYQKRIFNLSWFPFRFGCQLQI